MGTAMDPNPTPSLGECLPDHFARLWVSGGPTPDVFAYLSSHQNLSPEQRLEVLLVDQHLRWVRGQPLPLRVYLSAFPDIARKSEMVRALVDGDREERRRSAGRLNDTLGMQSADLVSQASTQSLQFEPVHNDTEIAAERLSPEESPTWRLPLQKVSDTRSASSARLTESRLSFALAESYHLQSDVEDLGATVSTVRFTLVRRLGAGGMGVVYEAYDQQRGELVALKTMRRGSPTSLVRFKQEFRALSDITHPNLVNLYELFAVEDRWFFTMELVEGCDLVTHVRIGSSGSPADAPTDEPSSGRNERASPKESRPNATAPRPLFDEARLRDALRQLAEGLDALHQAGKLHRDVKPTNVLVTTEGRVVLLDFGLTADLEGPDKPVRTDRQVVGTVAHMSPEQAAGLPINAPSDWYSVGVILYEALTGQLPFRGSPDEITLAKRFEPAPSPESVVEGLPSDLVRLCVRLLDRDPARRPRGREVIAGLLGRSGEAAAPPQHRSERPLIGRAPHRAVLDQAFSLVGRGKAVSVFVFGSTGTGKTTLVRSFLDELSTRDDVVVLWGRCYERESVPFKALDSLIDALARYLKRLPAREAGDLLSDDVGFLARLFPVLESVGAIAVVRREASEMPDAQELRRHAFAALRDLLCRLGKRAPLVLAIDDLQWGDLDSAILLSDLLCALEPPALLFVGCFRSEDAVRSAFLREISRSIASGPPALLHRELAVEPLTQSESRELALLLLERDDPAARASAHMIARESGGNPLFIDELVKHIQSGAGTERFHTIGQLDLDEVLWTRIQRQPDEAQRLLRIVAVSGRPIPQLLAFHASGLGMGGRVALGSLRSARLVRCIAQTQQDEVEIYHDRIRDTVVAHLDADTLRSHHEQLARALASADSVDSEVLAEHLRGAGALARAGDYFAQAADQAAGALAFDHAVSLYRTALELCSSAGDRARALSKALGDALANAGRAAEAAQAYLNAAHNAPAPETLELKRLAATHLLISGHMTDGLSLLGSLLKPQRLRMPESLTGARVSLAFWRALVRLRGLTFTERAASQASPVDLARIDLCWSAVAGLSMIEPTRGADFQARGLLLALRAGEPFRIARALAMEAGHRSTAGVSSRSRVASLLERAEALANRIDSPQARGIVKFVRGASDVLLGSWRSALRSLDEAERIFRNYCSGVAWERNTTHNFALWTLLQMGELSELRDRWTVLYRESQERGDLSAATVLTTLYMTMIKLAANEPFDRQHDLEAALVRRKGQEFNLLHSSALEALVHLHLYRGEISKAYLHMNEFWHEYARSGLFRIQMIRIQMLELRARTGLAMAEKANPPEPFLGQARSDAVRLLREEQPWAVAHSRYIQAGIASCEEDPVRAALALAVAAQEYDKAEMPLRAHIMRFRLGEIQTQPESRALRTSAELQIRAQGIAAPVRWAGMCAPGFAKISTESTETSF
jgi:serine/threonine protein kinase